MNGAAATLALSPARAPEVEACVHCGTALGSTDRRFCCHGCEAAADLIGNLGLDAFYRRREAAAPGTLRPGGEATDDMSAFVQAEGGRCRLQLHVDGLVCGACVWLVESALAREPAVSQARVNFSTRRLSLAWDGAPELAQALVARLAALGFRAAPFDAAVLDDAQARQEREVLRAMAVAGFAAANVMLLSVSVWSGHAGSMGPATRDLLHWVSALIALPAIAYAGLPFFRSAVQALMGGRTNMDVPISIGVTLAAGMSIVETMNGRQHAFFDSAITLLFFLLVGRYLDMRARGRARHAAQHVVALATRAVRVLRGDGAIEVRRPDAVQVGETVLVASGERVPVDGIIARGETSLDQSVVTGESLPIAATPGARVFAGTLNLGQPIQVETRAAGEGTLLAEIARLMEAAERGQGRYVALADRVARLYAPVVHVTGAATFLGWYFLVGAPMHEALMYAVAVLIITCPCALALAVPVVQVVASARLMRGGVLMKSATALERLAEIDTIVFDKTGTLTRGHPVLVSRPDAGSLRIAAGLAQSSRHPLARALVRAAPDAPLTPDVREHPGAGLACACSARRDPSRKPPVLRHPWRRRGRRGDGAVARATWRRARALRLQRCAARGRRRDRRRAARPWHRAAAALRRPGAGRARDGGAAGHRGLARGRDAGREGRAARAAGRRGAQGRDDRRRPQRRSGARRRACLALARQCGRHCSGRRRLRVPGGQAAAGRRSGRSCTRIAAHGARESASRHRIQRAGRAARHSRLRDAAGRRDRDVQLVGDRHLERPAAAAGRGVTMDSLLLLIPLAIALGLLGLGAFLWALRSGQFEDLDGAAQRILIDDEPVSRSTRRK
jgi:cbb3-type cytochrome oxidase maturation protein